MFKKDNDKTNEKIIKLYKNKLDGKYDILNNVLSRVEYIYKDVAVDEIDKSIVPKSYKKDPDMNDVYDVCFNTNNKMPFCSTLKEGFGSLDNTSIDYNNIKKRQNKQKIDKKKYYSEYYNNKY